MSVNVVDLSVNALCLQYDVRSVS